MYKTLFIFILFITLGYSLFIVKSENFQNTNIPFMCNKNFELINSKCYEKCKPSEIVIDNYCISKRFIYITDAIPRAVQQTSLDTIKKCGPNNENKKCDKGECCSVFGQCGTGIDYCVTYKRKDNLYDGEIDENTEQYIKLIKNPEAVLQKHKKDNKLF